VHSKSGIIYIKIEKNIQHGATLKIFYEPGTSGWLIFSKT
jgi:hypothetical protein